MKAIYMSERRHCIWKSPDGQVAIYLAFQALDVVNAAIEEAFLAGPIRGAEIGGLLLGKADRRAGLTVWIDAVELLPCRYPQGASFQLDPLDMPDMKRPEIAGYFRSHTRSGLFLSDYDQELIGEYFALPDQVFLLVKPFRTRPNLGGFFLRMEGKLEPGVSAREFPFDRRELGGGKAPGTPPGTPPGKADGTPGHDPAVHEPAGVLPGVSIPEKKRRKLLWAGALAVVLPALGALVFFGYNTRPAATPAVSPAFQNSLIGLSASEGERDVTLKWDRNSLPVQSAIRATVEIREGTFEKTLSLDALQLRTGTIVYSRPVLIADNVAFRVRLFFLNAEPIDETVQLVSNRPQP